MTREVTQTCKNCKRPFSYSERAFLLRAEKGESRPERCEECRAFHAREIKGAKSPYFHFRKKTKLAEKFSWFAEKHCFRGRREPKLEDKKSSLSKTDFSISDKEILNLYEKLEGNRVVIVVAPTGAGKSTFLPACLIEPPKGYSGGFAECLIRQGQIIITEPRIIAVQRIPDTIARILGTEVGPGHLIGFRHSRKNRSNRWNLGVPITDGTLPNWIKQGRLGKYSLIMVDEAHERSCNIDLILGFLKRDLPKYPHLRVLISSATINTQKFMDAFKAANLSVDILDLSCLEARRKHRYFCHFWKNEQDVAGCDCWLCLKTANERRNFWHSKKDKLKEAELPETIAGFVLTILKETEEGSILVFLHGEKAIDQTAKLIKTRCKRDIEVIPAYRRIQEEAEQQMAKAKGKRKVLIATNLAETSITLEDFVYEIDSGLIKQIQWDPDTQISRLPFGYHSQDGCRQRWGRLGRVQDGCVYCLYTTEQFREEFPAHTTPEILQSCLEDPLCILGAAGIRDFEQFPWLERPSEHPLMRKEIGRVKGALQTRGATDRDGEIAEDAMGLLNIPRPQNERSFLLLADEQGFLFEAITILSLMANREEEVHTGENLYNLYNGLLRFNPRWKARTKAAEFLVHQGLMIGCRDDLDFVVKLATCWQRAEEKGLAEKWTRYWFANHQNLQQILEDARTLIEEFGEESREESFRLIDFFILEKIRRAMAVVWPDRVVDLRPGNPVTFRTGDKIGVVSQYCVGNWQQAGKALRLAATEGEAIIDRYPVRSAIASFMVALPGKSLSPDKTNFFADQRFPAGSWVKIAEKNGKSYVVGLLEPPGSIKVCYRKEIEPQAQAERDQEIFFDQKFIDAGLEENGAVFEGIWLSPKKAKKARLVLWAEREGRPVAFLNSLTPLDFSKSNQKKGDSVLVRINRIVRDFGGGGFALAITEIGLEVPVELSELSISPCGYGLEQLQGKDCQLVITGFDEDGLPQLSNIGAIIEDLRSIREKIFRSEKTTKSGRRYLDLAAFVAEINAEEEKAVAVVPRRNGTLFHPFEISQTHVPGGSLKNLRLGEEVVVQLFLRPGFYEIPVERLTPEEIKNRPRTWELDESKEIVLAPWCLGDEEAEKWPARPEIIDFVRRQSWQYGFNARIISLQERQEWVAGANENIQRWSANIVKAREAIIKIQQNIALNSAKEREARSRGNVEWADRFQQWIQEGQQKIRDIEVSIRTWQEKISSVQRQLE